MEWSHTMSKVVVEHVVWVGDYQYSQQLTRQALGEYL